MNEIQDRDVNDNQATLNDAMIQRSSNTMNMLSISSNNYYASIIPMRTNHVWIYAGQRVSLGEKTTKITVSAQSYSTQYLTAVVCKKPQISNDSVIAQPSYKTNGGKKNRDRAKCVMWVEWGKHIWLNEVAPMNVHGCDTHTRMPHSAKWDFSNKPRAAYNAVRSVCVQLCTHTAEAAIVHQHNIILCDVAGGHICLSFSPACIRSGCSFTFSRAFCVRIIKERISLIWGNAIDYTHWSYCTRQKSKFFDNSFCVNFIVYWFDFDCVAIFRMLFGPRFKV